MSDNKVLKPSKDLFSPDVLSAYRLDVDTTERRVFRDNVHKVLSDVLFGVPGIYLSKGYRGRAFLYSFWARNPYRRDVRLYRLAHHGVQDLFVFNPALDLLCPEDQADFRATVKQTQEAWITFCQGQDPWQPFDSARQGPVFVFYDGGHSHEVSTIQWAFGPETMKGYDAILNQAN